VGRRVVHDERGVTLAGKRAELKVTSSAVTCFDSLKASSQMKDPEAGHAFRRGWCIELTGLNLRSDVFSGLDLGKLDL
jgi:hypothetical protein